MLLATLINHTTLAAAIFALTYVMISLQKIHFLNLDRPSAAMTGAILMVVCGILPLNEAYQGISFDTLALLLGMMVTIAYLEEAGFFGYASAWILRHGGTPRRMLVCLVFASGGLSALFVNDTICLLFTPIVLGTVLRAKLPPVPYLIGLVTASNIGSVMTLTGNPQNMLIGLSSGLPYGKFLLVMLPVGLVCLALDALILLWLYREWLPTQLTLPDEPLPPLNRVVVRNIFGVLVVVLAGFLLPAEKLIPGLSPGQKLPLFALVGGALAILLGRYPPRAVLKELDWPLLLFFSGLFIVFAGVETVGLLDHLRAAVTPLFGSTAATQVPVFSVFSVVASNLVSNVPFVLVARHWIESPGVFASPELMWYILALTSTFAGNLTIVGSVANIIVLEQSKEKAPIGFWVYLRAGVPITLATTVAGVALLCLLAFLGAI
jgi:Na+/H+ antiporter NhaD/arsenite permease-like protein